MAALLGYPLLMFTMTANIHHNAIKKIRVIKKGALIFFSQNR